MATEFRTPLTTISDLDTDWLSNVLKSTSLRYFTAERIGTGQVSFCYRVALQQDEEPKSIVLKIVSSDPKSRGAGLSLGIYEKETKFYNEIAPYLQSPAIAKCYYSQFLGGDFSLVLEDKSHAIIGDELIGATITQARIAVTEIAKIHARLASPSIRKEKAAWLEFRRPLPFDLYAQLHKQFFDTFEQRVTPTQRDICERLLNSWDAYNSRREDFVVGLVHGDFRLDNLLFGNNEELTIVDWQTVTTGPFMTDLAYFLGCSLHPDLRQEYQDELIKLYYESLGSNPPVTLKECYEGVRYQAFFGIIMAVASSMLVERTARGDEMFIIMFQRHCAQVLDLDSLAVLPEPNREEHIPSWIEPPAADEYPHLPGIEYLWNESWYFDVVDAGQGVACYIRIGLNPNQSTSWYMAIITGPDISTIAVLDYQAPLPNKDLTIETDRFRATQQVASPLQEYKVTLKAVGKSYDTDTLIPWKDTKTPNVPVQIDLTWKTVCKPYKWRLTTRYEIPCMVSGVISYDSHSFRITHCPGQRDHSWGVRDWWGMNWMWSAMHLSDGTHIHAVNLRFENITPINLGYVQREDDGSYSEIDNVETTDIMTTKDGLIDSTRMKIRNAGKDTDLIVEPVAHGALKLEAPDGRISRFARAWVNLKVDDGRTGVGWIEFNDANSGTASD